MSPVPDDEIAAVLIRNSYSHALGSAELELADADDHLTGAAHARKRLQREASMLNVLGELARLDSGIQAPHDRALRCPSRKEFRDHYYATNRPIILTGLISDCSAMARWTPASQARRRDQIVKVMNRSGADPKYELNGRANRREMRFGGRHQTGTGGCGWQTTLVL